MRKIPLKIAGALLLTFIPSAISNNISSLTQAEAGIQKTLNKYCIECHDADLNEGNMRLDNFSTLKDQLKFDVLNTIEEQVYIRVMPPEKKEQPSESERRQLFSMIQRWNELQSTKSKFRARLKSPQFGNYINHEDLFSGKYKDLKAFTYDRKWLVSEFIFKEKVNSLIGGASYTIDGKKRSVGGSTINGNVTNPFTLPETSGVRYYANIQLNSSHFMSMLDNANQISNIMLQKTKKYPTYLPLLNGLTKAKTVHDQTIGKRQVFLKSFIDRVCEDIYKESNSSYFPKYQQIKLKGPVLIKGGASKAGYPGFSHRRGLPAVSSSESGYILGTVLKYRNTAKSNLEIIRMCEQHWNYSGVDPITLEGRVEILRKYLGDLLSRHKSQKGLKYKPLSSNEMLAISTTIKKVRQKGMTYTQIIDKCVYEWKNEFERLRNEAAPISDKTLSDTFNQIFQKIYQRQASQKELNKNLVLFHSNKNRVGVEETIKMIIQGLVINSEFIVRNEIGIGKADVHGRKMLSPRDASYAIAYALTDKKPDATLVKAVKEGKLSTREDYKREILRILNDRSVYTIVDNIANLPNGVSSISNLPIRNLRFFRDFFGYHNMLKVFKDEKRFGAKIEGDRERLVIEADLLIEHILKKDKNVFEELLTTDKFYLFHTGDNNSMNNFAEKYKAFYEYFKDKWKNIKSSEDLAKHKSFIKKHGQGIVKIKTVNDLKTIMGHLSPRFRNNNYIAPYISAKFHGSSATDRISTGRSSSMKGRRVADFYGIDLNTWNYAPVQPTKIKHRKGILTHPAWLQTYSQNDHTDPVTRGKWIREKLLAGTIPDVPIAVDAIIPKDHTKTLRQRLELRTGVKECWKCHKYMNPLGNAFEMYDDFGRFRTDEELEYPQNVLNKAEEKKVIPIRRGTFRLRYKTVPVKTDGVLKGTGDSKLDGEVKNAHDMIDRLVKAKRVRQSIIRHAFRYFMGRNEKLSDSKTLIDADEAYVKSDGSFDAVIVSLLTSDSFIFRKGHKE